MPGVSKDVKNLAREVLNQDSDLKERVKEFAQTYMPLDDILREEQLKNCFGRLYLGVEALTDHCSGRIMCTSKILPLKKREDMLQKSPDIPLIVKKQMSKQNDDNGLG